MFTQNKRNWDNIRSVVGCVNCKRGAVTSIVNKFLLWLRQLDDLSKNTHLEYLRNSVDNIEPVKKYFLDFTRYF